MCSERGNKSCSPKRNAYFAVHTVFAIIIEVEMIPVIYPSDLGISEKNNFNSGKAGFGEIHRSEVIAQSLLDKRVYGGP